MEFLSTVSRTMRVAANRLLQHAIKLVEEVLLMPARPLGTGFFINRNPIKRAAFAQCTYIQLILVRVHPRNLFEDDRITTLGCQVGNVLQIQGDRKWANVARNMRSVVHWDPLLYFHRFSTFTLYAYPQFDSSSASALTLG